MFKSFITALMIGSVSMCAAHAAAQTLTACPSLSITEWAQGQKVSIGWQFQGVKPTIAFQPNGIFFGGAKVPLTAQQVAGYGATLTELRQAAGARKKVKVYWDEATKWVYRFDVEWDQSC